MERPRHFEDIAVGEERRTYGRTITETDFVVHAGHTGDFFPHHMDAEHMKSTPFGQRIAHGTMTFAIGIGLSASEINPLSFTYGFERLRFPKPVFIGDTIYTVLTIARCEDDPKRPDHGRVIEEVRVKNQRDEVVMACDHVYLVQRRPA
ncbi:MaoC/PaaZ C-terminal domain-containing protein [Martelella sp. FLE1502]